MDINSVLYEIRGLNNEERAKYLKREDIKNIIREDIFSKAEGDTWRCFRNILNILSVSEVMSTCSILDLINKFGERSKSVSIYFSVLSENNLDEVINNVINNQKLLDIFISKADNFYSLFSNISYDSINNILEKISEEKNDYRRESNLKRLASSFGCCSEEVQRQLIAGCDNKELLFFLVNNSRLELKSDFFLNDMRARYLYSNFNISGLLESGIKINEEIVKRPEFRLKLYEMDIIDFRRCINKMSANYEPDMIERITQGYYDHYLSKYNPETGLLKEFDRLLEDPSKTAIRYYDIIEEYLGRDENGKLIIKNKEDVKRKLEEVTSKRISEVIVDALFKDNIFNVDINIREMLRYNGKLDKVVLDDDKVNFYKYFLIDNIDRVKCSDKLELFYKLRNKSKYIDYYDDIRGLKDISYKRIDEDLIKIGTNSEYLSQELSDKAGVNVFDLRNKDYTMLVRKQNTFLDSYIYRRNCYSIISNENNLTFGMSYDDGILYGYNNLESDRVFHVFENDSFSSEYDTNNKSEGNNRVNRIMTSDEIVRSDSNFSEVQIVNTKSDDGKHYDVKKPDYIVVYDNIAERHIKESKRLNIPIVVISEKRLDNDKTTGITYNENSDSYVNNKFDARFRGR